MEQVVLGLMTFNTLGVALVLSVNEYFSTRRSLNEEREESREASMAGEPIPTQG